MKLEKKALNETLAVTDKKNVEPHQFVIRAATLQFD